MRSYLFVKEATEHRSIDYIISIINQLSWQLGQTGDLGSKLRMGFPSNRAQYVNYTSIYVIIS